VANLKAGDWIIKQNVRNVLFLHWPVAVGKLESLLPSELELDLYEGSAWIGIILFKAEATRGRFLPPIPGTASFLEMNVRTYVKCRGRSGVYFFSLNANSRQVVQVASIGSFMPYRLAQMTAGKKGSQFFFKSKLALGKAGEEELKLSYQPMAEYPPDARFGQWLTERYCLWTKPKNTLLRLEIQHTPWELFHVKGEICKNTMGGFLNENLHENEPVAHYSPFKEFYLYKPKVEK
jgi:uncharacterized protein